MLYHILLLYLYKEKERKENNILTFINNLKFTIMEAKRILIKSEIIIEEIEFCFVSGKNEIVITIDKTRFANNEEYIVTLKDLFKCKIPFMQDNENIYIYIKPEELTSISY